MGNEIVVAVTAVGVAFVNMVGSVLILWIRARYRWSNGHKPAEPSHGPPDPP